MALIIEDGSVVTDADSFASLVEFKAYADARGVSYGTDTEIEVALRKASDYLFRLEPRMKGVRVSASQNLVFPRSGVYIHNFLVDDTEIPAILKSGQIEIAVEILAGTDIRPNGEGQEVIMEKVGPIQTQYAESGSTSQTPQLNKVMDILQPLFSGSVFNMEVSR